MDQTGRLSEDNDQDDVFGIPVERVVDFDGAIGEKRLTRKYYHLDLDPSDRHSMSMYLSGA